MSPIFRYATAWLLAFVGVGCSGGDTMPLKGGSVAGRDAPPPEALHVAARQRTDELLGGVPEAQRRRIARLAAELAAALARAEPNGRLGRRIAAQRLVGDLLSIATIALDEAARPPPAQAALLGRLELGPPASVYPPILGGVALGSERGAIPGVTPVDGGAQDHEVIRRAFPPESPFRDARYVLRRGRVERIVVATRLTRIWPLLLRKAIAKWGSPLAARGQRFRWRRADRVITLMRTRNPPVAYIRFRRRPLRAPSRRRLSSGPRVRRPLPLFETLSGVRKLGPLRYRLPAKTLEELRRRWNDLARHARVVPHYRQGRPAGIKLFAIRPGSAFAVLGLRNGDVVIRVNGYRLRGTLDAEAFEKALRAPRIVVELERRGQPLRHTYEVGR